MPLRTMTRADVEAGALKSAAKGSPEYMEASTVTGLADKYSAKQTASVFAA
jgi:hypothetical protein